MESPNYVMANTTWEARSFDDPPTLEEVASRFGVPIEAFDRSFGVIGVAPGTFTVMVNDGWAHQLIKTGGSGPFPKGRIETMGPPVSGNKKS